MKLNGVLIIRDDIDKETHKAIVAQFKAARHDKTGKSPVFLTERGVTYVPYPERGVEFITSIRYLDGGDSFGQKELESFKRDINRRKFRVLTGVDSVEFIVTHDGRCDANT